MFAVRSAKAASIAVAAAAAAVLTGCSAEVHVGTTQPTTAAPSPTATTGAADSAAPTDGASPTGGAVAQGDGGDAALPKVSAAKVAKTTAQKLAAARSKAEPKVTCPDDLLGKVGTVLRCQLVADDGSTLGITVTVTAVQGTNVNFAIKADDKATPAASS
ncbi:DUF4333 domain-containing protein [Kitasatospora sp. YST-16]|uniref:DUF4333 domain-containing protein n=1 Tax=Kitasatospora sp. YST-16 TaxID=2998080 RepID=UPI00228340BE|nr:DUF4333 domain-containing protein [Kitasatospora sp. YST-16]WAL70401.1 DUF4333 domain-containing protein [Kitasatospora sp. YST-16]WNW36441.1 DUF4333 domain-containing protein [Streptomyces sp. Li-HN-5-13]